jgi:putative restriction endonuclease
VTSNDDTIRAAAFAHCRRLLRDFGGAVPATAIEPGFELSGERIHLGSTPRDIHRAQQMHRGVLSIKTTKPRQGRTARYDDAISDDGYFSYAFQGSDPRSRDNAALREAFEDQSPLIYFYALVPGVYQILFPCFVMDWDPQALRCTVGVGSSLDLAAPDTAQPREPIDRRYTTVEAKQRVHQAELRELVLGAYGHRCAISNLPVPQLLQAAHIIPDRDERGRPEVTNGLCLSTLHHTAYDRNLLGIDPDGQIHIAESVLVEAAIKEYHGRRIHPPRHAEDRPDRELLAARFEEFRAG